MSYVSLLKNIPEFLSQPAGIAAIASVGIHGAIAFIMPLVPVDSSSQPEETSSKNTVGILELNQAEQQRLPQTTIPKVALKPQTTQQAQLPPLPNFPNQSTNSLPPLPPSPATTQLLIPPIPQSPDISVSSLPKSQSLRIPKNFQIDNSFSAKQIPPQSYARYSRYTADRVSIGEPQPLASSDISQVEPPQAVNIPQPEPEVATAGNLSNNLPELQAASIPAEVSNIQPLNPVESTSSTIGVGNVSQPTTETASNNISRVIDNQPLAASVGGIRTTTTPGEQWLQFKNQYPTGERREYIAGIVDAPVQQEGRVEGSLVINAEGKVEDVRYLDNSVSSELKTAAREYIKEFLQRNPVVTNGKPLLYPFSLSFQPNNNNLADVASTNVSDKQQSLIENLRSITAKAPSPTSEKLSTASGSSRLPKLTPQLPAEQQASISGLRSGEVNPKPQLEQVSLKERLRSAQEDSQSANSNNSSIEERLRSAQANSNSSKKNQPAATTPQANQQQTSRQEVVVKQTGSTSQVNQQQTSLQEVLVNNQLAPESQKITAKPSSQPEQEEVTHNLSSSSIDADNDKPSGSQKLLQQLREVRQQRQSANR
jgi:hypothetical protein